MNKKVTDKVIALLDGQQTTEIALSGVIPAELFDLLEKQGYTHDPIESYGWEHNFSVTFQKDGAPSLCYSGSWFDGHSAIGIQETNDTGNKETADETVRRITGYPSVQAMIDASEETKRSLAALHERICVTKAV